MRSVCTNSILAFLLVVFLSVEIQAEDYLAVPFADRLNPAKLIGLSGKELSTARTKLRGDEKAGRDITIAVLAGKTNLADRKTAVDLWVKGRLFAELAPNDYENLSKVGERRKEFIERYLSARNAPAGPGRTYVVRDLSFNFMKDIATNSDAKTYHPAVKTNALLLIGMLDLAPGKHQLTPPTPLPEALPFLLDQFDTAPENQKAAAFVGICRHAELDAQSPLAGVDAATRARLIATFDKILGAKPDGRNEQFNYWLQRKSAKLAGLYGQESFAPKLAAIVADAKANLFLRLEAAQAYGSLAFADPKNATSKKMTMEMASLTLNALRNEVAWLNDEEAILKAMEGGPGKLAGKKGSDKYAGDGPTAGGGGMSPGGGGMSPGGGGGGGAGGGPSLSATGGTDLPAYKIDIARRRIKMVVHYLNRGMGKSSTTGLSRFASDDEEKKLAATLREELQNILRATNVAVDAKLTVEDNLTQRIVMAYTSVGDRLARNMKIKEEKPETEEVKEEKKTRPRRGRRP